MAPAYKLYYFSTRGRGEVIRWLLNYGNIDFEDIRFKREEWPELKEKMPFGQVPVLEHNGKKVAQSTAIARYVATQVGLAGNDDWENLEIDAIVDSILDTGSKLRGHRSETDPEKLKAFKEQATREIIPYCLRRLEALAQKNKGYLVLGRLTWADLHFVCSSLSIHQHVVGEIDIIKEYPKLDALRKKVLEIPAIKKWVEMHPSDGY